VKRFHFKEDIPVHMLMQVTIDDKEDQLTKLKKEKLLASIKCVQKNHCEGGLSLAGSEFHGLIDSGKMLRESVADLGDQDLALKLADDYARLTHWLLATHKELNDLQHPKTVAAPEIEYLHLEAQIWKFKLQKAVAPPK
jgi:hypothetical protein